MFHSWGHPATRAAHHPEAVRGCCLGGDRKAEVRRGELELQPSSCAMQAEERDMTLSVPLHGQERERDAVYGLRLANAYDIDQLARLRWW